MDEVIAAAKMANAHDFISALPEVKDLLMYGLWINNNFCPRFFLMSDYGGAEVANEHRLVGNTCLHTKC